MAVNHLQLSFHPPQLRTEELLFFLELGRLLVPLLDLDVKLLDRLCVGNVRAFDSINLLAVELTIDPLMPPLQFSVFLTTLTGLALSSSISRIIS